MDCHDLPIVFRFPNIYSGDAPQRNSLYAHFIQSAYNVTVLLSVRAAFWRNPISVSRKGLACCSKNFHLDGSSAFFNAGTAESRGTFHKKKFLTALWGISISFPIASVAILMQTGKPAPYQTARIHALFDPTVENHTLQTLRSIVTNSAFIGASNKKSLLQEGQNSDYILSTLSAYYGILAALVAVLLIFLLIRKIFQISSSQKNQLGMMMGYGCGMVFFVSAFWNVLVTLGLVFPTYTFLPFFSYGGVTMVVTYILLGIVLSIYRYKNVLSDTYMYKKNWDVA